MEKFFRKNRKNGITLIALVVTIIVLLILAGISISMLAGDNSILQKAADAKSKSDDAQIKERIQLAYHSALIGGQGSYTKETLLNELKNEFESEYDVDDSDDKNWVLYAKGQSVIIPAGSSEQEKYAIGKTIKISGEEFYIIENNENTLKLFAKYNINPSTQKQSNEENGVYFSTLVPTSYESSRVKPIVDDYVDSLGIEVEEQGILTKNEVEALASIDESIVYSPIAYDEKASYWLNTLLYNNRYAYFVWGNSINSTDASTDADEGFIGVRPYIVVSKNIEIGNKNKAEELSESFFLFDEDKQAITGIKNEDDITNTDIIIPKQINHLDVKVIEENAFSNCKKITSVTIPDTITYLSDYSFESNKTIKSIYIQNGVTAIGAESFSGCTSLSNIVLPDSITSVNDYLFWGCISLKRVTLGSQVKKIAESAFGNCTALQTIRFKGTKDQWNSLTIEDGNNVLQNVKIICTDGNIN